MSAWLLWTTPAPVRRAPWCNNLQVKVGRRQRFVTLKCVHSTHPESAHVVCLSSAVPCPPSQLSVTLNCSTNAAALTWNSSPNAVSYSGKAVSTDGHSVTCDAGASLSCQLQGLQCGKEYSFTVSASDGDCHSPDSNPVIQATGEKKRHRCFPFTDIIRQFIIIIIISLYCRLSRFYIWLCIWVLCEALLSRNSSSFLTFVIKLPLSVTLCLLC